jgi:hypothetical protein
MAERCETPKEGCEEKEAEESRPIYAGNTLVF